MGGLLSGRSPRRPRWPRRGRARGRDSASRPGQGTAHRADRARHVARDGVHALLNDPANPDHIPGARVVAAFKGGSPDVEASATRVDKFTAELRDKWKIEIVDSIEALLPKVDVVMIESVDARVHLAQARPVIAAKKPLFIDKPMAASTKDGAEIVRLAKAAGVPAVQRVVAPLRRGRADAARPTRRSAR